MVGGWGVGEAQKVKSVLFHGGPRTNTGALALHSVKTSLRQVSTIRQTRLKLGTWGLKLEAMGDRAGGQEPGRKT